jgi:hemolysin activation/secretion protein
MKNKIRILLLLVLACGPFYSCDWLKKLDDVTFDATLSLPFVINETAVNASGKDFSDSKLLNAASDPEVAKYASKINEFKVNKVTYTISGANPNTVTFTNGTLKVASTSKVIASASSINLASTTETDLTADTAGFTELASKLLDDKQETIQLQGRLSKTPVAFTVTFKFYVSITAGALD